MSSCTKTDNCLCRNITVTLGVGAGKTYCGKLAVRNCKNQYHHHHHHHVHEGLGVFPFPWSSKWSWSLHLFFGRPMFLRPFGLYCSAWFGILFLSILCTCCSHLFLVLFYFLYYVLRSRFSPNTVILFFIQFCYP